MKTIHWLGGLAALTLTAATGGASLGQTQTPPAGPQRAGPPPAGERGPSGRGMGRFRATPEEVKQLQAQRFARMDANHDGKVNFEEFRAFMEAQRLERQREAFSRLTGGKDSLTLSQLNERADARMQGRGRRMGPGGGRFGPGGGIGGGDRGR
ncbi:MAG: hypothetical protein ABIO37_04620 [Caulobacteraceae bacterium]